MTAITVGFLFASHGIGGAERSMLRLMEYGRLHGYKSHVLIIGKGNKEMADICKDLGIPVSTIRQSNYPTVVSWFRRVRPDVAYLFGRFRSIGWAIAARRAAVPCIVAAERSSADTTKDWLARTIDRYFVDGYIANSKAGATNLLKRYGIQQQRVFVIYNGIDDNSGTPARLAREGGAFPCLLCVANILPNKGQMVLLEAASLLKKIYPSIRVVLVGKDCTGGNFFNEAEAKGLRELFLWEGFRAEIREFLEKADVFVLPSIHKEGMPTAILEAMALNVPVVASSIGGIPELVENGRTGLLVEPGDVENLAYAIRKVLENPTEARHMAERAQDRVRERHTLSKMFEGHVHAFHAIRAMGTIEQ